MKYPEIYMVNEKTYFPKNKIDRVSPSITFEQDNSRYASIAHPLDCEEFIYERIKIYELQVDDYELKTTPYQKHEQDHLMFTVKNVLRDPAVEWAVMKSFDGVYICKHFDHAMYRTNLQFFVYLEPKHKTFWQMKFSKSHA